MANQAMDISADGSDPAPGRESGIVEVERKASVVIGSPMNASPDSPVMSSPAMNSPLLGGSALERPAVMDRPVVERPMLDSSAAAFAGVAAPVEGAAQRGHDIEIDLEVAALEPRTSALANGATPVGNSPAALDEETIQVLDDEIESAEVPRPTQPSSILSRVSLSPPGSLYSRPPPPSLRPRASSPSLPPPRRSSRVGAPLGSSLPPPSDQWILANKTLEIGRAHARIIALEEQVAFRDARIQTLEERLANARQKLEELESRLNSVPSRPRSALGSSLTSVPQKARAPQERREDDAFTPEPPGTTEVDAAADDASDDADDLDLDTDGSQPASGGPEDLRRINGIGPRFEAALRKQGITRLSQIAAWSDADVRQVAKALKIPKSRIVKGRWVEAAREMIGSRATSE